MRLKAECFPFDPFTKDDIQGFVNELVAAGLLVQFEFDGKEYWQVTGWNHQKIDKPHIKYGPKLNSKTPLPIDRAEPTTEENSTTSRLPVDDCSSSVPGAIDEQSPAEGNGREGKGSFLGAEEQSAKSRRDPGEKRNRAGDQVQWPSERLKKAWDQWRQSIVDEGKHLNETSLETTLYKLLDFGERKALGYLLYWIDQRRYTPRWDDGFTTFLPREGPPPDAPQRTYKPRMKEAGNVRATA